jgi:hypothetical protein
VEPVGTAVVLLYTTDTQGLATAHLEIQLPKLEPQIADVVGVAVPLQLLLQHISKVATVVRALQFSKTTTSAPTARHQQKGTQATQTQRVWRVQPQRMTRT